MSGIPPTRRSACIACTIIGLMNTGGASGLSALGLDALAIAQALVGVALCLVGFAGLLRSDGND